MSWAEQIVSRAIQSVARDEKEVNRDDDSRNPILTALNSSNFIRHSNVYHKHRQGIQWIQQETKDSTTLIVKVTREKAAADGKAPTDVLPRNLEIEIVNNLPYAIVYDVPGFGSTMTINNRDFNAVDIVNPGCTSKQSLHNAEAELDRFIANKEDLMLAAKLRYEVIGEGNKVIATCDVFDRTDPEPFLDDPTQLKLSIHHPFVHLMHEPTEKHGIREWMERDLGVVLQPGGPLSMCTMGKLDYYRIPKDKYAKLETHVHTHHFSRLLTKKDLSPDKFQVHIRRVDGNTLVDTKDLNYDAAQCYGIQVKISYKYAHLPKLNQYKMDYNNSDDKTVYINLFKS